MSQRLDAIRIKQEHIPYRDDNMNLKMALEQILSVDISEGLKLDVIVISSLSLKSKGSQTVKSTQRNVRAIKKIKTNLEVPM